MKKLFCSIFAVILVVTLFCFITVDAKAHPGGTDGKGGHTNRSTGEYHYHHGYSAHDHYDMDGDGIDDCPYNFKDKTDHSDSGGGSHDSDVNLGASSPQYTDGVADYQTSNLQQDNSGGNIYCYISLGFIAAFFILVNYWAIQIDRTDTSPSDEPVSIASVLISIFSTLIVFASLFFIMYLYKRPITWREISFKEMLQTLFFSAVFGSLVCLFTSWISLCVNQLLCKLFNTEVHGWGGSFLRLTIPFSYAFTVLLYILQ